MVSNISLVSRETVDFLCPSFFTSLSLSLCLPLFPALSRVGKKENPAIINRTLFHDTRGEPREEGTRRRLIDRDPLLSD